METKNIYQKLFEVKKAGIKLQRDTEAYGYKYATLSQIQEKLWEVMQTQGLLVFHYISEQGHVITRIINTDNEKEYIESWIPLAEWTKAQDKGSEISYYRRYNLLSLLDLEVEDDDGKKAQGNKTQATQEDDDKQWISDINIDNLKKLLAEGQNFTLKEVRDKYKVSKVNAKKLEDLWIK